MVGAVDRVVVGARDGLVSAVAGARDGLASAVAGARDGLASAVRLRGELATARLPEPPESIAHTEPVVSAALVVGTGVWSLLRGSARTRGRDLWGREPHLAQDVRTLRFSEHVGAQCPLEGRLWGREARRRGEHLHARHVGRPPACSVNGEEGRASVNGECEWRACRCRAHRPLPRAR